MFHNERALRVHTVIDSVYIKSVFIFRLEAMQFPR